MKNGFRAFALFSIITGSCFAETFIWKADWTNLNWTAFSWHSESGELLPDYPWRSSSIAVLDTNNFQPINPNYAPSLTTSVRIKQLQMYARGGDAINFGSEGGILSFKQSGAATDTVNTENAHLLYLGNNYFYNTINVPSGQFVRVYNNSGTTGLQYDNNIIQYWGSDTTKGLFSGSGTVVLGDHTTMHYNVPAASTDHADGYIFSGTVILQGENSNVLLNTASGNVAMTFTGSEPNSRVIIQNPQTFQNTHTFSGLTDLAGMAITMGTAHTVSTSGADKTYTKAELPSSALLFRKAASGLVLNDTTSIGGILQHPDASDHTINLNGNTLTINQNRESVSIDNTAAQGTISGDVYGINNFSGVISGTGGIIKGGSSQLELSGENTFTGSTVINAGTLVANNNGLSTSSSVTVSGGILKGTGPLPAVTVAGGAICPGNSIGTQVIGGNFSSDVNSTTTIELSPSATSLIDVRGTASTQGTLNFVAQRGIYADGTTLTFLTSTGTRSGTYAPIDYDGTNFAIVYGANSASIVSSGHHINPHPHHPGHHNSHSVVNHIISNLDHVTFDGDITFIINAALNHNFTAAEASEAIFRLTGAVYHALDRATIQLIERKARSVDEMFISRADKKSSNAMKYAGNASKQELTQSNRKEFRSVYEEHETSLYFEPYAVIYHQADSAELIAEGQVPFVNQTFGFGGGYELAFDDNYAFEIGAGYSFSALQWDHNFGNAIWNSIYFAPFLGWYDDSSFINGMVLGQCNFNDVNRKVVFEGVDASARGKYLTYDVVLRLNGGHRWAVHRKKETTDWLQGEGTVNYITMFSQELTETSNRSLHLNIKSKAQKIIQPRVIAKWIHEIVTPNYILAPVFKMGWVGTYQLNEQKHHAKFALSPVDDHFISTGHEHINQMMIGGELFYKSPRSYKVTSGIETLFLDHTAVLEGSVKWEWIF